MKLDKDMKDKADRNEGGFNEVKIKHEAIDLYKIIKGVNCIQDDEEFKEYLLDVFKTYNKQLNQAKSTSEQTCCVKAVVENLNKSFNDPTYKKKSNLVEKITCVHTFDDEARLQHQYSLQMWYLNFCKYLCCLVLTSE